MKQGTYAHKSLPYGLVDFLVAVLGGGGGVSCTIPADGVLKDDAAGLFPIRVNKASAGTYVSTGVYTVIYIADMQVKHLLHAEAIVVSDGASPTAALKAVITKLTPATRSITVKVYTPSGTLTDLGTSDLLVLRVLGRDAND